MKYKSEAQILYQMYVCHSLGSLQSITRGLLLSLQSEVPLSKINIQRIEQIQNTYEEWRITANNEFFSGLAEKEYKRLSRQRIVDLDNLNQELLVLIEPINFTDGLEKNAKIQTCKKGIAQISSAVSNYRKNLEASSSNAG